ncbi:hypothetical protein L210DRAFT_787834, partial [Boletus edulis BED1]
LNEEQKMAFTILSNHLTGNVPDEEKRPLLMIVTGSGGTGKTKLISTLAADLQSRGQLSSIARTATTGVASCLIGGSTLHSWAGIPARKLSNPFADLSSMLTGDFHQFPPVAQLKKALFSRYPPNTLCELGRFIFERFETVVVLKQQMRIVDETWDVILTRARCGQCTASDIAQIRKLVLVNPQCEVPNFYEDPWTNVVLITPRNCVRSRWNIASIHKHCKASGHILYIATAEDTIGNRPTTNVERLQLARSPTEKTGNLSMKVVLAIGMKIMITENVAPSTNLANGSHGTIKTIVLDPREPSHTPVEINNGVFAINLHYPPSYVTISMSFTDIPQLYSLDEKELPLALLQPLSTIY